MEGGDGADVYFVDDEADEIVETSGPTAGLDEVQSTVTYTLSTNVETMYLE
jgi:hypothetical protein